MTKECPKCGIKLEWCYICDCYKCPFCDWHEDNNEEVQNVRSNKS